MVDDMLGKIHLCLHHAANGLEVGAYALRLAAWRKRGFAVELAECLQNLVD
jgi:hypothetical protein